MLKKLRLRFILAGIIAFALTAVMLIAAINVVNYLHTTAQHDETLQKIHDYNSSFPETSETRPPIQEMPWTGGPESEFTLRFFSIRCNEKGELLIFDPSYISSIDEDTAADYTRNVLSKQKASGYYLDYRYLVSVEEDDIEIIFLNVQDANQYRHNLLVTSAAIGGGALVLASLLIALLSGYAIRPFVKNLEQQKQFITDAGHELKTPVTAISTSADILAMEMEDNEWVGNIQKQSQRLTKLIGDLVCLARMDEAKPLQETENFSLSEVCWELYESFSGEARAHNKTCTASILDNVTYHGDRAAVAQMLSILLDNAIRYSDDGGQIRLTLEKAHGGISLEVYNTCACVPDGDLDRLFDRFYRPDASRSTYTGGSGIGLSIARAIAQRHGGSITASSADGKSMTFLCRL